MAEGYRFSSKFPWHYTRASIFSARVRFLCKLELRGRPAGSITIKLAITILFLQIFIDLINLDVIVFVRKPWNCSARGKSGQLPTPASRSNAADELNKTKVGVSRVVLENL
ncbi:hypothetical protein HZ326_18594 [Fusarium oxysporum f. sp. albedinis]|nr:Uncharacterized protein HZ326_22130 [Fusarium oxysporum f. sp. albedinis]KAJ0138476.1 hypothetical protein HZ326_18594 [Fusarium oxysporum f. sp. albedinis]